MNNKANILTIINQDANKVAVRIAACGELRMSTAGIRDLLRLIKDNEASDHFIVDFGQGHVVTGGSVAFGALEAGMARETLNTTRIAAPLDIHPAAVSPRSKLTRPRRANFWTNLERK